jgi:hypothetical protein
MEERPDDILERKPSTFVERLGSTSSEILD